MTDPHISQKISRFPVPEFNQLPEDIQKMLTEVSDKAGFIPNVFLTLSYRPDELRAFFAYHNALMLRKSGLLKSCSRITGLVKINHKLSGGLFIIFCTASKSLAAAELFI